MTHLDLFSGIGGFALAAQANGFTTIAFCEIDRYAQQILIEKFGAVLADSNGEHGRGSEQQDEQTGHSGRNKGGQTVAGRGPKLHPDIFSLDGTQYRGVDLLTGGFPCQPFSLAGKRRGAADDRALWPEMFRVIHEAQPAAILAENVPGIINMELDHCLSDLEGIGYACWPIVVPACAVDARHRRDRVWIVGHSKHPERRQGEHGGRDSEPWHDGQRQAAGESGKPSEDVADCLGGGLEERQKQPAREELQAAQRGCMWPDESEWFPESPIRRVAHGIPNRSHRLRALGNAIVPQVAAEIIRCMITPQNLACQPGISGTTVLL